MQLTSATPGPCARKFLRGACRERGSARRRNGLGLPFCTAHNAANTAGEIVSALKA